MTRSASHNAAKMAASAALGKNSFLNQSSKGTEMTDSIRTYIRFLQGKRLTALWAGFQNG